MKISNQDIVSRLKAGMQTARNGESASNTVTIFVDNFEGDKAQILDLIAKLTVERVELELDFNTNQRVYHNDQKVIEVHFEDYVNRNGWRRDYVPVETWKKSELKYLTKQ